MKKAAIILSIAMQRAESPIINSAGNRPAKWGTHNPEALEAPTGRNQSCSNNRIPPRWGLAFASHSFRRAIPCAVDGGLSARNTADNFQQKMSNFAPNIFNE